MNEKERNKMQLECLYDMFRDRIEENVIYIVYTENEGKIDSTIDQLMPIASCSFTGHDFEASKQNLSGITESIAGNVSPVATNSAGNSACRFRSQTLTVHHTESNFKQFQIPSDLDKQQHNSPVNPREHKTNVSSNKGETENSTEEEKEGLDVDEKIERLQQSIEDLLAEKNNCHDKASQYLNKKMFPVTSYYSELASQYRRMIEAKTRKLVDLLLMKSQNANTIDLHGLNPLQAREVVRELLNIRLDKLSIDKQGEANIDIITGWGKHTMGNTQHRVRPTVVAYLREKGFEFIYLNKGALRVTIRR